MSAGRAELKSLLDYAVSLAQVAGEITLRYFRQASMGAELKFDGSFVTRADREAESFLRRARAEKLPADALLGEEEGGRAGASGVRGRELPARNISHVSRAGESHAGRDRTLRAERWRTRR